MLRILILVMVAWALFLLFTVNSAGIKNIQNSLSNQDPCPDYTETLSQIQTTINDLGSDVRYQMATINSFLNENAVLKLKKQQVMDIHTTVEMADFEGYDTSNVVGNVSTADSGESFDVSIHSLHRDVQMKLRQYINASSSYLSDGSLVSVPKYTFVDIQFDGTPGGSGSPFGVQGVLTYVTAPAIIGSDSSEVPYPTWSFKLVGKSGDNSTLPSGSPLIDVATVPVTASVAIPNSGTPSAFVGYSVKSLRLHLFSFRSELI